MCMSAVQSYINVHLRGVKEARAIPKLPSSHFKDKMKLSGERSRDCNSL